MAAVDKFDSTIVTINYEDLIVRILVSCGEVVWGGMAPSCSEPSMQLNANAAPSCLIVSMTAMKTHNGMTCATCHSTSPSHSPLRGRVGVTPVHKCERYIHTSNSKIFSSTVAAAQATRSTTNSMVLLQSFRVVPSRPVACLLLPAVVLVCPWYRDPMPTYRG